MKPNISNSYRALIVLLCAFNGAVWAEQHDSETHEPPACKYCPEDEGWQGHIDIGLYAQDNDDDHFGRYTGYADDTAGVLAGGQMFYRNEDGFHAEVDVHVPNRNSNLFELEGGQQGVYDLGYSYRKYGHIRGRDAWSPYRQEADGSLTLPAGWVTGVTTDDMPTLAGDLNPVSLSTERTSHGVRVKWQAARNWSLSAAVSREEKQGTRDFGATFGFNQSVILPLPVNYQTDDVDVKLDFSSGNFYSQFGVALSQFNNRQHRIRWQNPYDAGNGGFGQLAADSPDNEFQQISALLGYRISDDTRVSVRIAGGKMEQNESFLPYTINPSISSAALPFDSLNGRVDTSLVSLQLNSRLTPKLRFDTSYSSSERDNKTASSLYTSVITDNSLDGSRVNRPYSYQQDLFKLKLAYQFDSGIKLSGGIDDDTLQRDYSSVEETHDQTLWLKLRSWPMDRLEASLKLSVEDREASDYVALADQNPLFDYPDAGLYNNELLRMFNMTDRKRQSVGLSLAYALSTATALAFDVDALQDEYDDMYLGLQDGDGLTMTASLSSLLGDSINATLYYSQERLEATQNGSEKLLAGDPGIGWVVSDDNKTATVGLSLGWAAFEDQLDIGFDLTYTDFDGDVEYSGATDLPQLGATLYGLSVHGDYLLDQETGAMVGFEVRYEAYKEDNWNESGAVNSLPTLLSLGTAEADSRTTLALVTYRVNF